MPEIRATAHRIVFKSEMQIVLKVEGTKPSVLLRVVLSMYLYDQIRGSPQGDCGAVLYTCTGDFLTILIRPIYGRYAADAAQFVAPIVQFQ